MNNFLMEKFLIPGRQQTPGGRRAGGGLTKFLSFTHDEEEFKIPKIFEQ
jgi:hypothetical protein